MQRLEVSCAVRRTYTSLSAKRLMNTKNTRNVRINVTRKSVRVTIVVVEKQ